MQTQKTLNPESLCEKASLSDTREGSLVQDPRMMRVLVAIASYGHKNDPYLARVVEEYLDMDYRPRIVVFSNVARDLGPDVEVRVGLPDKDPWSLPFAHKRLFAQEAENYDLFVYSEDDILLRRHNLDAFLAAIRELPEDVVPGFVRVETGDDGTLYFDALHSHFHWDTSCTQKIGPYTLAFYTNEHSACYMLTQGQLKRALKSGGFLVPPHEGKYDLLCAAATDPYTQCGFKQRICISHLDEFAVYHLPNNKFRAHPYRASVLFHKQIDALLRFEQQGETPDLLFNPETKALNAKWSKDYYEPVREEMLRFVPADAKNVLSIGVGWGATEGALVHKGIRVVGIPIDSVIGACAESKGVEVVYGSFRQAREQLDRERFDCILLSNVLHLVEDPSGVLALFAELLRRGGSVVVATPNFASLPVYLRRLRGDRQYKDLGSFEKTGMQSTNLGLVKKWFRRSDLKLSVTHRIPFERARSAARLKVLERFLAAELVVVGRKER